MHTCTHSYVMLLRQVTCDMDDQWMSVEIKKLDQIFWIRAWYACVHMCTRMYVPSSVSIVVDNKV